MLAFDGGIGLGGSVAFAENEFFKVSAKKAFSPWSLQRLFLQ